MIFCQDIRWQKYHFLFYLDRFERSVKVDPIQRKLCESRLCFSLSLLQFTSSSVSSPRISVRGVVLNSLIVFFSVMFFLKLMLFLFCFGLLFVFVKVQSSSSFFFRLILHLYIRVLKIDVVYWENDAVSSDNLKALKSFHLIHCEN